MPGYISDPSIFAVSLAAATLFITLVVSLAKPLIEAKLAPTAPLHDAVLRLFAVLVGIVLVVLATLVGSAHPGTTDVFKGVINGVIAGVLAMGSYSAVTTSRPASPATSSALTDTTTSDMLIKVTADTRDAQAQIASLTSQAHDLSATMAVATQSIPTPAPSGLELAHRPGIMPEWTTSTVTLNGQPPTSDEVSPAPAATQSVAADSPAADPVSPPVRSAPVEDHS